ncbi:MAG TPA: hypothetical protein V6C52_06810 [Coleofasciculaceae cyanobacterium]
MATVLDPQPKQASSWLFAPWLDILCLGGLSLVAFLAVMFLNMTGEPSQDILVALLFLNIFINYPHYSATYYRVYRRTSEIRKYPLEAIWSPLLLTALGVLCSFSPAIAVPWLGFVYIVFSGYHYSGQTYGVSMIFLAKEGFKLNPWHKQLLALPIYVSFLYSTLHLNTVQAKPLVMFDITIPKLGLPPVAAELMLGGLIISVLGYVGLNYLYWNRSRKIFPMMVQVILVAHIVWFALSFRYPLMLALVPAFHCLQYLLVTTFSDFREQKAAMPEGAMTPRQYLASHQFTRYYGFQVLVGSLLFLGLPFLLSAVGLGPLTLMLGVVAFLVNLHHFILDGAIWKLRKPEVATTLIR